MLAHGDGIGAGEVARGVVAEFSDTDALQSSHDVITLWSQFSTVSASWSRSKPEKFEVLVRPRQFLGSICCFAPLTLKSAFRQERSAVTPTPGASGCERLEERDRRGPIARERSVRM